MFSLYLECSQDQKDRLIAELWDRGSSGLTETDLSGSRCSLRAFFENDADAPGLARAFSDCSPRWQTEEPRDWVAVARSRLEPLCVGERFFLVPGWRPDPTPPGRFRIEVNPGLAFGTGAHESTQLCLEALERELKPAAAVFDVGTGSGILARAARLLGAGRVIACDVDPVAIALAAEPLSFVGSADAIRPRSVDLVAANLSPEAIITLASELARVLRAGGVGIVSGFEVAEAGEVEAAFDAVGLVTRETRRKGEWEALVAVKR
jgi:ribosomal protein L11 methyltransferase